MNVYDSDRMADILSRDGYTGTDTPEDADLVLLSTCHIREKAAEKVYSEVGRLRVLKEHARTQGRDIRIAVAGCVAQAEGKEILARAPAVDLVVGPQSYHRLPELISQRRRTVETEFEGNAKFEVLARREGRPVRDVQTSAFLTVQEGCDKFCTFCVVPY